MAEIKIEKKKPVWPWVLVILIILAAIYAFWHYSEGGFDTDDMLITDTVSTVDKPYKNNDDVLDSEMRYSGTYGTVRKEEAFADYLSFVDNMDNKSADKSYYRLAFFKLITATKRMAEIAEVDVSNHIAMAMDNAEELTNDPDSSVTADKAKNAADEVSKALDIIQKRENIELSQGIERLKHSAENIDATQPLDQQERNIDDFFDRAARVLQSINESYENR